MTRMQKDNRLAMIEYFDPKKTEPTRHCCSGSQELQAALAKLREANFKRRMPEKEAIVLAPREFVVWDM